MPLPGHSIDHSTDKRKAEPGGGQGLWGRRQTAQWKPADKMEILAHRAKKLRDETRVGGAGLAIGGGPGERRGGHQWLEHHKGGERRPQGQHGGVLSRTTKRRQTSGRWPGTWSGNGARTKAAVGGKSVSGGTKQTHGKNEEAQSGQGHDQSPRTPGPVHRSCKIEISSVGGNQENPLPQ